MVIFTSMWWLHAEAAESQEGTKGPTPPQIAPKQSDSTESTPNPVKAAFPLGKSPCA